MKKAITKILLSLAACTLAGCASSSCPPCESSSAPSSSEASSTGASSSEGTSSTTPVSGLSIAERRVSFSVGGSYQIETSGASGTLSYSSNNPDVATVSESGLVSASKVGTAIIRISDSSTYVLLEVNIVAAQAESVLTLSLGESVLSLSEGDVYQLSSLVKDGSSTLSLTPTYDSSDKDVATISAAGLIAAKKAGTSIISASVTSGSKSASASLSLTVSEFKIALTPTFSEREVVKDETPITLDFVATGRTGEMSIDSGSLVVTPSDPLIASVADGKLTGLKKGTVNLKIDATVGGVAVSTTIAIRVRERYTVSYTNVATAIASEKVLDGEKIVTRPADPVKGGYVFQEWTANGAAFDFAAAVEADTVISPHFLKIVGSSTADSTAKTVVSFDSIESFSTIENSGYNFYNDGSGVITKAGEAQINLQTKDKLEFAIGLPLIDFVTLRNSYMSFSFGYDDMSIRSDATTVAAAGKTLYSFNFLYEDGSVNLYVNGSKTLTLATEIANGTAPLVLTVVRTSGDLYAGARISPIKQNVYDYQSFIDSSLAVLDAVEAGKESENFASLLAYSTYLGYSTSEEKASYVEPASVTRFKTAIGATANKLMTFTSGGTMPDGFESDATNIAINSDNQAHFQLQSKGSPYKTAYYISFPLINFRFYSEVNFAYAYGYDEITGSIGGTTAFALVSGGGAYSGNFAFKNESGSVNLYTNGTKMLTLDDDTASGAKKLKFDITIVNTQDYADIRFTAPTAHF